MQIKIAIITSFLLLLLSYTYGYGAEYVLVCNKECPVAQITAQEVERIFLRKKRKWKDNSTIEVVINTNEKIYDQFTRSMLNKSSSQFSNYWRRILFSGKDMLPVILEKDSDIIDFIKKHPRALSYINMTNVTNTIKALPIIE